MVIDTAATEGQVNDSNEPTGADEKNRPARKALRAAAIAALLVFAVLAVYADDIGGTARYYHPSNPYIDPLPEVTVLRSPQHLSDIFSERFLIVSDGKWRPLGYAIFCIANTYLPRGSVVAWHLFALGVHVLAALILADALRRLAPVWGFVLAVAYALNPALVPVVNDVGLIPVLFALLFCTSSMWFWVLSVRAGHRWLIIPGIAAFGAALLCHEGSIVALPLLAAVLLFARPHPNITAWTVMLGAAGTTLALALGVSVQGVLVCMAAALAGGLAVESQYGTSVSGLVRDVREACIGVIPAAGVIWAHWAVARTVQPIHLYKAPLEWLRDSRWTQLFTAGFAVRSHLLSSPLTVVAFALPLLLPLCLLLRRKKLRVACASAVVLATAAGAALSGAAYRNDLTYWRRAAAAAEHSKPARFNMATACLEHGHVEEGLTILQDLYCVDRPKTSAFIEVIASKLGRAYELAGNDKLAGYFLLHLARAWTFDLKLLKQPNYDGGRFALRTGYLSAAELHWANNLVTDPKDAASHTEVALCIAYRGFYRAAEKMLDHALELDPRSERAAYLLAFVEHTLKDDARYKDAVSLWRRLSKQDGAPDFQPIYDGYSFEAEKFRNWFSGDPLTLGHSMEAGGNPYVLHGYGRTFTYPEVPLELARCFMRHGFTDAARETLLLGHNADPTNIPTVRALVEVYTKSDRPDEARVFAAKLREMEDDE